MKKFLSLLIGLAMALSTVSCGGNGTAESVSSEEPSSTVSSEPASSEPASSSAESSEAELSVAYPVTVTDQAGREVIIEEEPQRLVSGYYISTSVLIALGLEEKLVGVEAKADKRAIYKLSAPGLMELPSVGTAKEFDLEGCAVLEPDLVILPLKLKSAAETLEGLGIKVLLVNPEDQELLSGMIELLGTAANAADRAQELLDFTAEQQAMLADKLAGAETPTVYLAGNSSLLSTAGDAMYQSDMIRLAGGVNAASEIPDTYWAELSYEQLLTCNPDYIVLASDADYTVEDVLSDANLADCAAVANGQVCQLPGKAEAWDSPVPSGILGAVWLAGVLHPEAVTEEEVADVIDDYYETFYDFTYSKN